MSLGNAAPAAISHPALFQPKADAAAIAAARAAQAEEATAKAQRLQDVLVGLAPLRLGGYPFR